MTSIGIVGSGIAGLHLGLFLQQHGIPATIYSDRTPAERRRGRLPNTVGRAEHTFLTQHGLELPPSPPDGPPAA